MASCPWAVGRLKSPGPTAEAWLSGFDAAAKEQGLRLAERFAVRENDEVGRELNRRLGIHVGRPIQPKDLETEIERIANSLGVTAILQPNELRLASRQVSEKYEYEADSDDFLNSFFLHDLERIAGEAASFNNSAALGRFLSPEPAVHTQERCDVRTSMDSLWQHTAPALIPAGRWPAPAAESLYFSQQFALNSALDAFDNQSSPLFGVNGPPGTRKTTLLRDLIASILVRRAQILSKLWRPEDAFEGAPAHWNTAGYARSISPWREEFLGFEIVVASSNNRAVENVTLEIPAKRAIAEEYPPEIDYFADFATRLLSEAKQKGVKQDSSEAWGLLAARLGSKRNRSKFVSRFWFADKECPEPRSRAEKGFQKYLQTVKAGRLAWKNAAASFEAALKDEARIRQERVAAWKAVEAQTDLKNELSVSRSKLQSAKASALAAQEEVKRAADLQTRRQISLDEAIAARRDHQHFKPGLVDALFTRGAAYHHWHEKDRLQEDAVDKRERELRQAGIECEARQQTVLGIEEEIAKLAAGIIGQDGRLSLQSQLVDSLREKLGPAFPLTEHWLTSPDERELSSPWVDEAWNRARTRVLIEALHLHRTFMECLPDKIRKNLHGAMDILQGKVSPAVDSKALQSAWARLFFIIPVISTTFASFDRLFSHAGRESLGWLLIDEAAQATPQSAAGALWRSKRAIVLGDPRQLEPIVSLPFTAQQALRAHFGVEETWLPSKKSVQTLADRVSRFGTWLHAEDSEMPTWVGSPLRVHRRCEQPMFSISNQIAYDGQMVYDTEEVCSSLPRSCWIDVAASESDDHWIPAEGVALQILLADLFRSGLSPASVLLISPFRAVARKLKDIGARLGILQAGTIHVSQGKEADVVILVLGGDPKRPGAKDWASEKPNLLNVAMSRAKRRLFIIGDRSEWSQYPNFSDASASLGYEQRFQTRSASSSRR